MEFCLKNNFWKISSSSKYRNTANEIIVSSSNSSNGNQTISGRIKKSRQQQQQQNSTSSTMTITNIGSQSQSSQSSTAMNNQSIHALISIQPKNATHGTAGKN